MTLTTVDGCGEVAGVHAGRIGAVVAGGTRTQHLVVIDVGYGFPDDRTVAVLADIGCLYVGRALAGGVGAIVTARAIVDDSCVIKRRRRPRKRCVAIVTVIAAADMCRMFAGRRDAIMAGATGTENLGVIDRIDRNPDVGRMTVFADIAGLDVGLRFARGVRAVVAA